MSERMNLKQALKRAKAIKGAPGVDSMTAHAPSAFQREHWPSIRDTLPNDTFQRPIQPVRRVEIPTSEGGGVRKRSVPSALHRFVQQAESQGLSAMASDRTSGASGLAKAESYIPAGHCRVVDLDQETFFDRVCHIIPMGRVARRVSDRPVPKLIRLFLTAGVPEIGLA